MGIVKKRLIKYSVITFIGLILFIVFLSLSIYYCRRMNASTTNFILGILMVILSMVTFLITMTEAWNLETIIKYYVKKEKDSKFITPMIYNVTRIIGIIITISTFVLGIIFAVFMELFVISLIIVVTFPWIGICMIFFASYLRSVYFNDFVDLKMMKCPICKKDIPKKAHYCIYCDKFVTDKESEELKEVLKKLDDGKTSFYK